MSRANKAQKSTYRCMYRAHIPRGTPGISCRGNNFRPAAALVLNVQRRRSKPTAGDPRNVHVVQREVRLHRSVTSEGTSALTEVV